MSEAGRSNLAWSASGVGGIRPGLVASTLASRLARIVREQLHGQRPSSSLTPPPGIASRKRARPNRPWLAGDRAPLPRGTPARRCWTSTRAPGPRRAASERTRGRETAVHASIAVPRSARGLLPTTRRAVAPAPPPPGARACRPLCPEARVAPESRAAAAVPARVRPPAGEPSASLPGALPRLRAQLRTRRRSCPGGGGAPFLRASRPIRRPCCKSAQIHGYLPARRLPSPWNRLELRRARSPDGE